MRIKELTALLVGSLLLAGCGDEPGGELDSAATQNAAAEAIELASLQTRNEVRYQPNQSKPYSGWVKAVFPSGQLKVLGKLKDGKWEGVHTIWWENGQKRQTVSYKDNKKEGLEIAWTQDGHKDEESMFKGGKRDGPWISYSNQVRDGENIHFKYGEVIYKDGEEVSATYWNEDGKSFGSVREATDYLLEQQAKRRRNR